MESMGLALGLAYANETLEDITEESKKCLCMGPCPLLLLLEASLHVEV